MQLSLLSGSMGTAWCLWMQLDWPLLQGSPCWFDKMHKASQELFGGCDSLCALLYVSCQERLLLAFVTAASWIVLDLMCLIGTKTLFLHALIGSCCSS